MIRRIRPALLALACFGFGCVVGIWLQHRWPVGRWRSPPSPPPQLAPVSVDELARIPAARRLVIVAAGQSNAANYVAERAAAGPGVYVFSEGAIFSAIDPLPGGDNHAGSIWTRLGPRLLATGDYDAVIFAVAAVGSTRARDWAPGGVHHHKLRQTLRDLARSGLPPDFILWQQGESEAWNPAESGRDYLASLRAIQDSCRPDAPTALWLIARSTWGRGVPRNTQITTAQELAALDPGTAPGPDFDLLGAEYRSDGVHFSAHGAEIAALRWFDALQPWLNQRRSPSP